MDIYDVERTRRAVKEMVKKEGEVQTRTYLLQGNLSNEVKLALEKAGIVVGESVDFSKLPIRKADFYTSRDKDETIRIVKGLIDRDGLEYTISDLKKEVDPLIQKKLMEAGLMFMSTEERIINVPAFYSLAKSSDTASIQAMKRKSSP